MIISVQTWNSFSHFFSIHTHSTIMLHPSCEIIYPTGNSFFLHRQLIFPPSTRSTTTTTTAGPPSHNDGVGVLCIPPPTTTTSTQKIRHDLQSSTMICTSKYMILRKKTSCGMREFLDEMVPTNAVDFRHPVVLSCVRQTSSSSFENRRFNGAWHTIRFTPRR